jgi:hypothetical protein
MNNFINFKWKKDTVFCRKSVTPKRIIVIRKTDRDNPDRIAIVQIPPVSKVTSHYPKTVQDKEQNEKNSM